MCDWDKYEGFEGKSNVIDQEILQLDEYFTGTRSSFEISLMMHGTNFQISVWKELQDIPYGATVSYSEIALRIGKSNAVRAVANAIGANLISIFIPCHRVIGSNGTLTGYRGGLNSKRKLLELETKTLWT